MDKLAKNIIYTMAKYDAGTRCSLSDEWNEYGDLTIDDLCKAVQKDETAVLAAVRYLVDAKYAEYFNLRTSNGPLPICFQLSHMGLAYRENKRLTSKERWKERFIGVGMGLLIWAIQEFVKYLLGF